MKFPKVLVLLQNFYGSPRMSGWRLKNPVYDLQLINRKNATYSRIVPYLENDFQIFFGECTPMIGTNKDEKFPTDLEWVKKTIEYDDWFAVLAFSNQAHKALEDINYQPFAKLPHPVSFKWRKQMMLDVVESLQEKLIIENNK